MSFLKITEASHFSALEVLIYLIFVFILFEQLDRFFWYLIADAFPAEYHSFLVNVPLGKQIFVAVIGYGDIGNNSVHTVSQYVQKSNDFGGCICVCHFHANFQSYNMVKFARFHRYDRNNWLKYNKSGEFNVTRCILRCQKCGSKKLKQDPIE